MIERPGGDKLISSESILRETPTAPMASIDAELRRIGEELSAGSSDVRPYMWRLHGIDEELRSRRTRAPSPELDRRIGIGQILQGAAYGSIGQHKQSAAAFDRAIKPLKDVGLEDLPAEALLPYAEALLRAHKLRRAADAIRQVARRGYGEKAGQLAVAVADELNRAECTDEGAMLLREFAAASSSLSVPDDRELIAALDRHGLPEMAAARCLTLGAKLDPADPLYRDTFVRAVRLSPQDPAVVVPAVKALATIDSETALDILNDLEGPAAKQPGVVVVRAEILALQGETTQATELLEELDARTKGIAATRGLVAYLKDEFPEAVGHLLMAIRENKNDQRSTRLLGDSVHRIRIPDPKAIATAEKSLRRLVSRRGPDGETLAVLAQVQEARGNDAGREATLNQAAGLPDAPSWVYSDVGESRRRARKFPEAIELFAKAIELDPTSAWAIGSRGQALAALGEHQLAISDFTRALLLDPALDWAFDSAREIAPPDSEEITPVFEALRIAVQDPRRDPPVREGAARRIAFILTSRGDQAEALKVLEQAGTYAATSPKLSLSKSWVRWQDDDLDGARLHLSEAAALDDSLDWVIEEAWAVAVATEPLRTALFDRLLTATGEANLDVEIREKALLTAVYALDSSLDPEVRCKLLERALELNDTHPIVWTRYGEALLQRGRSADAVNAYGRAANLQPNDPDILVGLGMARHQAGNVAGAIDALRHALFIGVADERWATLELANVLLKSSPQEARDLYRRLLRTDPADVFAARGMSEIDVAEGRTGEAMAILQRTLNHAPENDYLRSDIALLALRMEDIDLAVSTAEQLVSGQPDSVVAALTLGMVHNEFGEWRQALAAFDRALELEPHSAEVHGYRAWALEYDGRRQDAADALEEALRYDENPYFKRELALVLRSLDDERASKLLAEAVSSTASAPHQDAHTLAHEGFCRVALGQFNDGADQLMSALDIDPTNISTQIDLALALLAGGRTGEGLGEYRRALARVAKRHPRRQVGLLRVALVDLICVRRWFPDVAGFDHSQELIARSLASAESAVSRPQGSGDPWEASGQPLRVSTRSSG